MRGLPERQCRPAPELRRESNGGAGERQAPRPRHPGTRRARMPLRTSVEAQREWNGRRTSGSAGLMTRREALGMRCAPDEQADGTGAVPVPTHALPSGRGAVDSLTWPDLGARPDERYPFQGPPRRGAKPPVGRACCRPRRKPRDRSANAWRGPQRGQGGAGDRRPPPSGGGRCRPRRRYAPLNKRAALALFRRLARQLVRLLGRAEMPPTPPP